MIDIDLILSKQCKKDDDLAIPCMISRYLKIGFNSIGQSLQSDQNRSCTDCRISFLANVVFKICSKLKRIPNRHSFGSLFRLFSPHGRKLVQMKPVCLIIGAGAGIGGCVAKRFAGGGYHVVLSRRSDQQGLDLLIQEIQQQGGTASGRLANAVEVGVIETLVAESEKLGAIEVVIFNLGAQIGTRSLAETSLKQFELGWRMACLGLFRAAQAAMPGMLQKGKGCFLVTSSTAAMRGNEGSIPMQQPWLDDECYVKA